MCKNPLLLIIIGGIILAQSPKYGVGRAPTPEEVKAWDISIPPDGTGLPEGSGTAAQGKEVYASKCAKCHGGQGQGGDDAPLVGGQGSLRTPKPLKTIGSFWPYATTLFDYTRRAMPFKQPGTLTDNQVYAVVAHSGVVSMLSGLLSAGLITIGAPPTGPNPPGANLGIFVPMLEETSFVTQFLSAIDLVLVWWVVTLSIGLAVLYKRRTGGIAFTLLCLYVLFALVIGYARSGS